jgi:hypothetical protein
MIKFFNNLALNWAKNATFFARFYGKIIFKIITSVPGHFLPYLGPSWDFSGIPEARTEIGREDRLRGKRPDLSGKLWSPFYEAV